MVNPVKLLGSGLHAISMAGKGLGKVQKLISALTADVDNDGTPEYKEALDGLLAMWNKAKDESIPALKNLVAKVKAHVAEYKVILDAQVIPNVKSVFEAARKAAHEEE